MTPAEQKYVYEVACEIIAARNPRNPYKPMTQQQILDDLALSRQQIENGETTEAKEAFTAKGESTEGKMRRPRQKNRAVAGT